MHLLNIEQSGDLYASGEAVDLGQSPADMVILTAADSEISLLAEAASQSGFAAYDLRLANILTLSHPFSIDLYIQNTLSHARMIVVRLLGGSGYWPYGVEQLSLMAKQHGIILAMLPGDGRADPELDRLSTLPPEQLAQLTAYLDHGGMANACALLMAMTDIMTTSDAAPPPRPLLKSGLYWPGQTPVDMADMQTIWNAAIPYQTEQPPLIAAIVFYRALMQSGQTAPVDALISALTDEGIYALPIYASSLKEAESAGITASLLEQAGAGVILNAISFAVSDPVQHKGDNDQSPGPFGAVNAPVLQVVFSTSTKSQWQDGMAGLNARDLAMNVVLPELDGRIISRAVGFKTSPVKDTLTEAMVSRYEAEPDRAEWVARLAKNWLMLSQKPRDQIRLAMVMANYPNRDGRLANGVGLDTPASALTVMRRLEAEGYHIADCPGDTRTLMDAIKSRPTNSGIAGRQVDAWMPLADYKACFAALPASVQQLITERWGMPETDPMIGMMPDAAEQGFALPVVMMGHVAIAIQPARGYNIDPKASYHSPDLPPPHHYLAFYFWCRHDFQVDAVIHLGKHGNLEWLPGKALALDADCLPEICLGPMPHFYPFIVNDPGEGSQAKRRSAAVIIDHLTPPMTLADSHGVMAKLEASMDEYYEAVGVDTRRTSALMDDILSHAELAGLATDCGINAHDSNDEKLQKLDNYLCDIKDMQIRDGLHIFGQLADDEQQTGLLTAIMRIPRGDGSGDGQSILRTLAADILPMAEGFDPLTTDRALPWEWDKPAVLDRDEWGIWRSHGDVVERLNALAVELIAGRENPPDSWANTRFILDNALPLIRSAVIQSPEKELYYLMRGLAGGYVPAGASGAPTRGKPEVLPTGRNFFSVDTRAVPSPVAWRIGWASAHALLDRYVQDHGDYPAAIVLSVWGTANMRTGGDDLAQALALMGVEPKWDSASRRVTGFDVMPVSVLGRPRVDVTLRASGFFRDAFPAQIALFDKAVRAVASLDEPEADNPLAARWRHDRDELTAKGMTETDAARHASFRVFSAMPGAYGAGMQTLIDEGIWDSRADFAETFIQWGGYAYGEDNEGVADHAGLTRRLKHTDAVLHNQDNREHDILDSDDYYQFAGGLAATVAVLKGQDVPVYMGDHALAERPQIRSLAEEISRVVRGRASNPKWIKGVMRHGYKGAFEMAATLDYLFAFAATTRQVKDHHFEALFDGWVENEDVAQFLKEENPDAWQDILNRFQEAIDRGLWHPRRNATGETLMKAEKI